jgi:beta-galactosidase GanA
MMKETMNHNSSRDHQKREGRALRLPSTKPTTKDTRIVTSFSARGMTDPDWKSPDIHQGTLKDGSSPQQLPNTTDTALHTSKPPQHLGHEISLHVSARLT